MKITCFGDYIIHFSPLGDERFAQAELMHMSFTGAEANVCAALAYWGKKTGFVTSLPNHQLAQKGVSFLKSFGIDTDFIKLSDEGRMGVYYLENGRFLRSSSVIYDRDNTVFTNSKDYNWEEILADSDIFYVSGITPTLSENLFEETKKALAEAKRRNIKVFLDINYRPKLSTPEESYEILKELLPFVTCLIGNEEHLKMIFGISSAYGEDDHEKRIADILNKTKEKTGVDTVAVTVRRTVSASRSIVFAGYLANGDVFVTPRFETGVVDRVGSGDAFSAGLIYAFSENFSTKDAIHFAVASNAIKHTVSGDINYASAEEIKDVMYMKRNDVRR